MISLQLILLTTVLNCTAPNNTNMVGFWETERTSKGGIGHTFEFQKDGSYLEAVSVIVDQKYRYENGKLTIFDPQEQPNNEMISNINFDLLTLTVKGPDGSTLRKDRADVPSSTKPSIVGVWKYRHYTGGIAYERFTSDGIFQFRLPMTSSTGCYMLKGDQLTVIKNNKEKISIKYRLHDGKLEIENKSKAPTAYRLEKHGPWYPRDKIDYQQPAELKK